MRDRHPVRLPGRTAISTYYDLSCDHNNHHQPLAALLRISPSTLLTQTDLDPEPATYITVNGKTRHARNQIQGFSIRFFSDAEIWLGPIPLRINPRTQAYITSVVL